MKEMEKIEIEMVAKRRRGGTKLHYSGLYQCCKLAGVTSVVLIFDMCMHQTLYSPLDYSVDCLPFQEIFGDVLQS